MTAQQQEPKSRADHRPLLLGATTTGGIHAALAMMVTAHMAPALTFALSFTVHIASELLLRRICGK